MLVNIHIEVVSTDVEEREVNGKAGLMKLRNQSAFLVTSDERRKVRLSLNAGQSPYPKGRYGLGEKSFKVGSYGDLELNKFQLELVPLQPAVASAARAG